jgi:S-formylglutathione hydrolase
MEIVEERRSFGGRQLVYEMDSAVLGTRARVGVYVPPDVAPDAPVVLFLSGLTCTEQNVITKGGAQRAAAEVGVVFVAPDTSPRGDDVADDPSYDLGQGAGFYLTATEPPWSAHYRMDAHVLEEALAPARRFSKGPVGLTGHSMGGHGALTLGLRHPERFASLSAFAPILEPMHVPWGVKAFTAYLGDDRERWRAYSATELLARSRARTPILIDQGTGDDFLATQLTSDRFLAAAEASDHPVTYRRQEGYGHSYYFVASFLPEHLAWHAEHLRGAR